MHLRIILPTTSAHRIEPILQDARSWTLPGTTLDAVALEEGPASIESARDEALAGPGIVRRVEEAAADGVDGVFITCFGDPGVHAAREIIDAPVVGGFEPALLSGLSLGERVGIVTVLPSVLPLIRGLISTNRLEGRVGALRVVDVPVLALHQEADLVQRLFEQASDVVARGEADVIVLGCTGMRGVSNDLRKMLASAGMNVPVVDPTGSAITWLESQVRMGLLNSRTTYSAQRDDLG